jgi:ferredoxin
VGLVAWKVIVDFDLCTSNALCMLVAPEVFEVRDDGFLYLLQEEPSDDLRAKVEQAILECPSTRRSSPCATPSTTASSVTST